MHSRSSVETHYTVCYLFIFAIQQLAYVWSKVWEFTHVWMNLGSLEVLSLNTHIKPNTFADSHIFYAFTLQIRIITMNVSNCLDKTFKNSRTSLFIFIFTLFSHCRNGFLLNRILLSIFCAPWWHSALFSIFIGPNCSIDLIVWFHDAS